MSFPDHLSHAQRKAILARANAEWLSNLKVGDTVLVGTLYEPGRTEFNVEKVGKGLGTAFKVDGKWFNQAGFRKNDDLTLFPSESDLQAAVDRINRDARVRGFFVSFSWRSRLTREEFERLCDLIVPVLERKP